MSSLTKVLEASVKNIERTKQPGRYRLGHHLMPPVGWLNDPNGLCWFEEDTMFSFSIHLLR